MSEVNKTEYNSVKATKVAQVYKEEVTQEVIPSAPKVQPVTTAKVKKRGLIERLVKGMFGPERVKSITEYVGREVIAPAFRDIVRNSLHTTVDMMLYRDGHTPRSSSWSNGNSRKPNYNTNTSRTNYNSAYQNAQRKSTINAPVEYDFDIYYISDMNDANEILKLMREELARDGQVPLSYYYYLINKPTTYVDQTVGWVDLSSVRVVSTRAGYYVDLPYPVDL